MINETNAFAGEDDAARLSAAALNDAADPEGQAAPEDTFDIELDGQVHTLPAALKGAFLRQADYTRKTQELAEHRRASEAERRELAEHRHAIEGAGRDRIQLAVLDQQLSDFAEADWEAISQADPQRAQALWSQFQQTQALRDRYAYAVGHHEARGQLQAAREAAEQMAETGRTLQREIDGWSPEVANKLVEYAQAFGVTLDELAQMADPRLWKVLHRAYRADEAEREDGAARSAAQAQAVRPAITVGGAATSRGGVRDELGTKEWMARRNAQMTRGR